VTTSRESGQAGKKSIHGMSFREHEGLSKSRIGSLE